MGGGINLQSVPSGGGDHGYMHGRCQRRRKVVFIGSAVKHIEGDHHGGSTCFVFIHPTVYVCPKDG